MAAHVIHCPQCKQATLTALSAHLCCGGGYMQHVDRVWRCGTCQAVVSTKEHIVACEAPMMPVLN